ncbi:MAG TPA: C1 family peptidase [Thermoanaerobaculia bacterium]|nr:C1 family peptidase [Thermoanaerobaculia bacterium]
MEEHGLGYVPDIPKVNDYTEETPTVAKEVEKTAAAAPPAALPTKVDLRQWFSPIEDQGSLGSCTANAAAGILEYFEKRAFGKYLDASRLFLYKVERELLGWTGDTGAYLRTAMEALTLFGAPPERYWPYDGNPPNINTRYELEPTPFCFAFAGSYRAIQYFRLDPNGTPTNQVLDNIKRYLAAGFPSMFGFPVYSEFDNPLPGGLVAYPAAGSNYRGGHAIVAGGYDDNLKIGADTGALLVRNSWGTGWANGGYGWMSYRYVTKGLANDWWTMIKADWVDTGQFS